jgi:hypothetical protein
MVCLAKVVLEMGPRSPLPSGRSAAKARPTKLGNLVTGPLSIAPASRSCGVQNTEYHLTPALEACDAPKSSRVIDGPEQGTGQGTSACGWRDEDKERYLHRRHSTELVT